MTTKKSKATNKHLPKLDVITVRCTRGQKKILADLANREGLPLSTWLLHKGLLAAQTKT